MVVSEALLQFDKTTEKTYVEIEKGDQSFERVDIETGISDGINIEIISGISIEDKIKVWNQTKPEKIGGVEVEISNDDED